MWFKCSKCPRLSWELLYCWQVNHEERTVKVEAGILLTELNELLFENGLALSVWVYLYWYVVSFINRQSITQSVVSVPRPKRVWVQCIDDRCLSVCLSVPCLTLSREWKAIASSNLAGRKPTIRLTRDPHLEVKRSNGHQVTKVTRPLNTVTENRLYLLNGKAYELQSWNTDRVRWPSSLTCSVTCKLKALGVCSRHHL